MNLAFSLNKELLNSAKQWVIDTYGLAGDDEPKEYPLSALSQYGAAACQVTDHRSTPVLERIAVIGTPYSRTYGLQCARDVVFMRHLFKDLASAGIFVAPNATFTPLDLRLGSGHDFLAPENAMKADLVVISMIAGISHPERRMGIYTHPALTLSEHDKGIRSWERAVLKTDAKLVISYFIDNDDVNTGQFRLSGYRDGKDVGLHSSLKEKIHGHYHSMSSLVSDDYATALDQSRIRRAKPDRRPMTLTGG